ncbi:MAG: TIGR00730 family Rossman fold protein [Rhizobiales bacterium]|nr:TIGR00730 family Rossman fold protein [Hyphomicrobiales bacterium]
MAVLRSICVYCGSGAGSNPAFVKAAVTLGRAMAEADIRLIYGGGSVGLMGTVARAVLEAGGEVTGIIPRFLQGRERKMDDLTETILTEDMHQRKMLMFERADAFVALPGGVGTLEELVEQITWAQLGRHRKPVLIGNIDGFWDALVTLLEAMRAEGFIRREMDVSYLVARAAEEIVPALARAVAETPETELRRQAAAGPISRM